MDEYFQYDPFNCVWTYIEGVLLVKTHYLCIGDIIKLTFKPYFHKKSTTGRYHVCVFLASGYDWVTVSV